MIVARAHLARGAIPLPAALTRDGSSTARRPVTLLTLEDKAGRIAQGEASPLERVSPDTFEDADDALDRFAADVTGRDVPDRAPASEIVAALGLPDDVPASARNAIETALLGLVATRRDKPLRRILGGTENVAPIAVNALLPPLSNRDAVRSAVRAGLSRGVTLFKAKIGRCAFDDEMAALEEVFQELAGRARLRLDANGAFALEDVSAVLDRLATLDPDYVEQPVDRESLFSLRRSPVPLAADESLQLPGAISRLAALPDVTTVVLKPAALGGPLRARRLASEAVTAGLDVVVTHLAGGPVDFAGAAELALSLERPPAPCGLAVHAGLAAWAARPPHTVAGDGTIRPLAHAGLGLPRMEPPS